MIYRTTLLLIMLTHYVSSASREPKSIEEALKFALVDGETLSGRTVESLRSPKTYVSAVGSVENFGKWIIKRVNCEIAHGSLQLPPRNVQPGEREAYASRSSSVVSLRGSWIRFSFLIDEDILLHVTYMIYRFPFMKKNRLAIALCAIKDGRCRSLSADKMLDEKHEFLVQQVIMDKLHSLPLRVCYDNMCVIGTMTYGYKPTIKIQLFPKCSFNLSKRGKSVFERYGFTHDDYKSFMTKTFSNLRAKISC